jgi:TonB family protein
MSPHIVSTRSNPARTPSPDSSTAIWIKLFFLILLTVASAVPLQAERATVRKVPPVYPPLAKQMHLAGTISVTAQVDANGTVTSATTSSGNKLLAPAAIEAVKQWKFAPGQASTETVQITFSPQ